MFAVQVGYFVDGENDRRQNANTARQRVLYGAQFWRILANKRTYDPKISGEEIGRFYRRSRAG
jgi:hypothetical protein